MSTTVELGKATAEIARLRAGIRTLAAYWEAQAGDHAPPRSSILLSHAEILRRLLDES